MKNKHFLLISFLSGNILAGSCGLSVDVINHSNRKITLIICLVLKTGKSNTCESYRLHRVNSDKNSKLYATYACGFETDAGPDDFDILFRQNVEKEYTRVTLPEEKIVIWQ